MVKRFKEKAPAVQAIEFINALTQSPEVANLIGASAVSVDVAANRAVFTVDGVAHTVQEGQVIGIIADVVTVTGAAEFYAKYEAI